MNCRNAAAVLWGFQLMKSLGLVELVSTADRGFAHAEEKRVHVPLPRFQHFEELFF